MADIKADINAISKFRDGVGVDPNGLVGMLATRTYGMYSAKLTAEPEFGQHAGRGAFTEAKDLAGSYVATAMALMGHDGSLQDLISHLNVLHGAADNATKQYANNVYTEANAADTLKNSITTLSTSATAPGA